MPVSEDCRANRHDWVQSTLDDYYNIPGEKRPAPDKEQIVDVHQCSRCGIWQVTWDPSR